ncbi:hypothetical protein LTR85_008231 [Meristemomyces frigidus]|nr:hypothetical protein LTR85_008231 [Meristemomyces frigidus]
MAEIAVIAPASHSQPSRKGKKAWRKNVDISEVQTGLEDVRDEIIKGGVIAEKDANELFATDVTGDAEIAKQQRGKKLLKSEEILAQRSAVPGLDGRKRKMPDVVVPGSSKRQKNGAYVSHKDLQRLRNVGGEVAVEEPAATHDPWNGVTAEKDPRLDFLDEAQPKREPKTLKEAPIPLSANGKRIPDIRKPSAGKSYNPLVDDWSALLAREGAAAVSAEQQRLALEAAAAEKEARALAEAEKVEQQEKDEYAGTDYESAWESEWEGFQSGAEGPGDVHVQKLQKRKTPAERNKVKARKEREAREKWEKKQKVREAEEKRITQIAKEMSVRDKARRRSTATNTIALDSSASDSDGEAVGTMQRRRFGKLPIPEAPLEVVLPDELQDSLRRLKPEGNLLTDRYRNLLVNGKVEVRRRRDRELWRRKQVERTEKWSYKDWKLK